MFAIDALYKAYKSKLLAIARHFGNSIDEAEDIVHQFYLDLLQKGLPGDIRNPEAFITIAFKRRLIDLYRANRSKKDITGIEDFYIPSTQEIIEKLETDETLINQIAEAYKKLPARYRKVIYMKYYQGYSTEKIVTITGFTHQTVYNNLSKGIQQLRQNLKNEHPLTKLAEVLLMLPF